MVAALLRERFLFSSVPTVYGAEMDEKVVTEGVETTSEVTDDVQLSEAEESLDTAELGTGETESGRFGSNIRGVIGRTGGNAGDDKLRDGKKWMVRNFIWIMI